MKDCQENEGLVRPLKIGSVTLKNNILLAPLAGYSDIAFRRLARDFGVGLTTTEMVSVSGLNYENENTKVLLATAENECPSCAQLFGSSPEAFAKAVQKECLSKFDIIDINMGCPVDKVTKNGAGSALMKDSVRAAEIVAACAENSSRPITVKMRLGWEEGKENAEQFAKALEKAGASMLCVHGRVRSQMYRGKADWNAILRVKNSVSIPVVGNGDITTVSEGKFRLSKGVDGIMLGRGAIGHPEIFSDFIGQENPKLIPQGLYDTIMRQIKYMMEYFSEHYTVTNMRKHLAYYLKGVPDMKDVKQNINYIESVKQLETMLAPLKSNNIKE